MVAKMNFGKVCGYVDVVLEMYVLTFELIWGPNLFISLDRSILQFTYSYLTTDNITYIHSTM